MRERRGELEAAGIGVIAAGFSPAAALAGLAEHLDWPWPFLSDPERLLYRRLGLPRVGLLQVYTPATLRRYAVALLKGRAIQAPVEDTRQLGGDAIVRRGDVLRLLRTRGPDDRAPVSVIVAAALTTAGATAGPNPPAPFPPGEAEPHSTAGTQVPRSLQ